MGRPPRVQESELHYHVICRCNNDAFHFKSDEDFAVYLAVVKTIQEKHGFKLFNYKLMHSHVHLFLQPSEKFPLERTLHWINSTYAHNSNLREKRKGHFWLERYKSIPVESDKYALDLMRYINRNAVRAGIVKRPEDWKWSGYRFYAFGEQNDLLQEHPTYLGLSTNPEIRKRAFREYVEQVLPYEDQRRPDLSETKYIGSEEFADRLGFSTSRHHRKPWNF